MQVFIDFVKEQAGMSESSSSGERTTDGSADGRPEDMHGISNPLAANLTWLEDIDPDEVRSYHSPLEIILYSMYGYELPLNISNHITAHVHSS